MNDDEDIAGTVECPYCCETVLLEIDRGNPIETDEDGKATEFGPPMGECCGRYFVMQPDGTVEIFDLRK